jgi:hypothetical protein
VPNEEDSTQILAKNEARGFHETFESIACVVDGGIVHSLDKGCRQVILESAVCS